MTTTLLLLVPDLFFQSRLDAAARRLGWRTVKASDAPSALARARAAPPAAAVVDLGHAGALPFLEGLRADPALARVRTLGFLSHVRADLAAAARAAGCAAVLAKSALAEDTAARLRELAGPLAAPSAEEE